MLYGMRLRLVAVLLGGRLVLTLCGWDARRCCTLGMGDGDARMLCDMWLSYIDVLHGGGLC